MKTGRLDVLYSGTSYPVNDTDWRGKFIARILEALDRSAILNLSVCLPPGNLPPNVKSLLREDEADWMRALMEQGGVAQEIRSKGVLSVCTVLKLLYYLRMIYLRSPRPDLVHVNWLQNALPLLGTSMPAVISVLGSDFALMKIPGMKTLLRLVIRQRKCVIAPNGEWMVPGLKKMFGDIAEVRAIPFGVDRVWLNMVRKELGSRCHKWIAVTRLTEKKIGNLFDWGTGVFGDNHELHLLGPMQEDMEIPDWVIYHGPVTPEALHRIWFPQASGLITLSRHSEGRPQVMIEAMAAGLPVIASNIPAHADFVQHHRTGCIVSSPKEMKESISFLSVSDKNRQVGNAAKEYAANYWGTWDDCAKRYLDAYQTLLTHTP